MRRPYIPPSCCRWSEVLPRPHDSLQRLLPVVLSRDVRHPGRPHHRLAQRPQQGAPRTSGARPGQKTMTPKRRRLWLLLASLGVLGAAAALVLTALDDNLVFFYSPTQVAEKNIAP